MRRLCRSAGGGGRWPFLSPNWTRSIQTNQPRRPSATALLGLPRLLPLTHARLPKAHDVFWAYRESLLAFIGRGEGQALEVGCGEGRVSRALRECGYHVTATDPVAQLIAAAEEARSADEYAVASAGNLPFEEGGFDLVVAYNMLMDVEDVAGALREMRRVLRQSGTLLIHCSSVRGPGTFRRPGVRCTLRAPRILFRTGAF